MVGIPPGRLDGGAPLEAERFTLEIVNDSGDSYVLVHDLQRGRDAVVVTFSGAGGYALAEGVALAGLLNERHAAGGDVRPMLVVAVERERRKAMQAHRRSAARVREVNARLAALTGPASTLQPETGSARGTDTPQNFLEHLSGFTAAQRKAREDAPAISGVAYERTRWTLLNELDTLHWPNQ